MTEVQARELGKLYRRARRARRLSLRTVDELTGVSYGWLRRMEAGQIKAPSPHRLTIVAEAIGLPPERLDRITRGKVAAELPAIRTYFRAKYKLTPHEIERIERVFDQ